MGVAGDPGMAVAALLCIRLSGVVLTAPVLSARAVPRHLKAALIVLLTILLWSPARELAVPGAQVSPTTILTEASVGILLGLGAAIFVAAAGAAGDMMAVQMGLSGANVLDPLSETQMPVLGQLLSLFVVTSIVALGGHLVILQALAASLRAVPVGGGFVSAGHLAGAVRLGGYLFVLGLRFAAPVVAAMMVGNVALGIMARTVPQLNVLMVAFPLQIALGLFTLSVSLPLMATFFSNWPDRYVDLASALLQELAPGGGS